MLEHFVSIDEPHVEALLASFMGKGLSQMAFPNPTWTT
jgi:hypothetical protein